MKQSVQHSYSEEGGHVKEEAPLPRLLSLLKKPAAFIIVILVCVILLLSLQFGALQREIDAMGKQVQDYKRKEDHLDGRVTSLKSELRHVEREESELKRKERQLEAKEQRLEHESWGELAPSDPFHEVHMLPLVPHRESAYPSQDLSGVLGGLTSLLKGHLDSLRRTGPAAHHRFKPLLPTHNILKPGAHPAHDAKKAPETKDEHKAAASTHADHGKKDAHPTEHKAAVEPKHNLTAKKIQ